MPGGSGCITRETRRHEIDWRTLPAGPPPLPIGDRFTTGPREAPHAIRPLGVRQVIAVHDTTFEFLKGTVEALRNETKKIKGLKIYALKPGEKL